MKPAYEFHTPQFFIRNVIDGDFPSFQKDSLSLALCVRFPTHFELYFICGFRFSRFQNTNANMKCCS